MFTQACTPKILKKERTRLGKTRSSTNPIFCPIFLQIIPPHHPLLGLLLRGLGGLERSVDLSVDGAHCHCTP